MLALLPDAWGKSGRASGRKWVLAIWRKEKPVGGHVQQWKGRMGASTPPIQRKRTQQANVWGAFSCLEAAGSVPAEKEKSAGEMSVPRSWAQGRDFSTSSLLGRRSQETLGRGSGVSNRGMIGSVNDQDRTLGNWGSIVWDNSGRQGRTHLGVTPQRGKGAGLSSSYTSLAEGCSWGHTLLTASSPPIPGG